MNNKLTYEDSLEEQDCCSIEFDNLSTDLDNRVWKSYVRDIDCGDNFASFCQDFFEMLDEEEYWEH